MNRSINDHRRHKLINPFRKMETQKILKDLLPLPAKEPVGCHCG
jgi:hypothetical protein